jgi:hypothetical protein
MSATPAAVTAATTAASATIGQTVDAELAVLKARVAVVEAKVSTDWADVKAWVKTSAPHFVTWALAGATAVKAGVLADVVKFL